MCNIISIKALEYWKKYVNLSRDIEKEVYIVNIMDLNSHLKREISFFSLMANIEDCRLILLDIFPFLSDSLK